MRVAIECRPQYVQFPNDSEGFAMDDQFYVGRSGLLVKPVVEEEAETATVYLADDQVNTLSPLLLTVSPNHS
jgi:alpha-glucosidase (family GH31 glycosyl hydrolase)